MLFGILNVNKPDQLTSRDVVNRVVRQCPKKTKVGHAGTLDPMATGVLAVAIGPATKLIQYVQATSKTYIGGFRLGFSSDTEDITGNVTELPNASRISESNLVSAFDQFTGEILQTPPQFSAIKVDGQRAYKAARKGQKVDIKPRPTKIESIRLLEFDFPDFQIEIKCGKGTYIRTLARDIAKSVGSDAVMTSLIRTAVGDFSIEDSHSLERVQSQNIVDLIQPPRFMVSDLPQQQLTTEEIQRLNHGKRLSRSNWANLTNRTGDNAETPIQEFAAFNNDGQLLAIMERKSLTEFGSKINFVPQLMIGD